MKTPKKPTGTSDKAGPEKAAAEPKAEAAKPSSARPPRHSKSTRKPMTIDLKAEDKTAKKTQTKTSAPKAVEDSKPASAAAATGTPKTDVPSAAKTATPSQGGKRVASSTAAKTTSNASSQASSKAQSSSSPASNPASATASPSSAKKPDAPKPTASTLGRNAQSAAAPAKSHKTTSDFFGKLVAAVIGGLIALGGAGLLQFAGILGSPGGSAVDTAQLVVKNQLDTTKADLEKRFEQGLAALQKQIETAQANGTAATAGALNEEQTAAIAQAVDSALAERLAQQGPASSATTDPSANNALQEQLAALTSKTDTLTQQTQSNDTTLKSVSTAVDRLETEIANLSSAISSGTAGEDAGLKALNDRLTALSGDVVSLQEKLTTAPASDAASDALRADINTLKSQIATLSQAATNQDPAAVTQLAARLAALSTDIANVKSALTTETSQLAASISKTANDAAASAVKTALADSLKTVDERLAKIDATISDQQQKVLDLTEQANNGADRRAARAIAAAALTNDINRGVPFDATLAVMRQFVDAASLKPLEAFASTGIATADELRTQFAAISGQMVAEAAKSSAKTPLERLQAAALDLVKVQPLTPIEGTSPAAIVSRISAALQGDDLATANTEWGALPDAVKALSKDWQARLAARITANELLTTSIQSFVMAKDG
ncbi:MAG: hypothetical protein AAGM04_09800 [Pseudomonadota bacterium]